MHLTLPRTHPSPAKPPATTSPSTPGASGSAPASPPNGVKRIVSGLKRRISHTFLRGHRHHASNDVLDLSHPSRASPRILDEDEPISPFLISADQPQPIPISVTVSSHPHLSVDTLTRSVANGGLGKHVADCSDSSDATSDYSFGSSFRGRGHRTESSGSGSFSYTSPGSLQAVTDDEPHTAPLREIAESLSSRDRTEAPAPPESAVSMELLHPATVDDLALSTPLPDDTESELGTEQEEILSPLSSDTPAGNSVKEDNCSTESLHSDLSPECIEVPIGESGHESLLQITRDRTLSLASVESLTAPLESLVLSEDVSPPAALSDSRSDTCSTHVPLPISTSFDVSLPPVELDVLEEPRQRKLSMLSIESLTAPLEILVLPDTETAPCISPDTEPESTLFDVSLSIPLPPSTPDSPSVLPVESPPLPEPEDEPSITLGPRPIEQTELPPALSPANPSTSASDASALRSFAWVLEYFTEEQSASSQPALAPPVLPATEQPPASAAPLLITPFPSSAPGLTHSAPPTPPLAASSDSEDSEEDEDFEFHPLGLTMAMPTLFFPSPKVRYPAFSSLTWWLPRGL